MTAPERISSWSALPPPLRRAGIVALTTAFLAAALLYQENIRSDKPPAFSRGGSFARDLSNNGDAVDLTVPSPVPLPVPTGESHSSAVVSAPGRLHDQIVQGPPFPAIGRYIYAVDGTESTTLFGSRAYPPEMTMTVHRGPASDPTTPALKTDELAFDLDFSQQHEEREIVAFRKNGIMFTFEAGSVTFGPSTRTSQASYVPPMTQVPVPLTDNATVKGTSRAVAPDGSESRVEDWNVQVDRREQIVVMGKTVDTYVVEIARQSRPGSDDQVTRSRTYWLDPLRSIWVKFEDHLTETQRVGFGTSTYHSDFTATLDRVEPI